ncbi:MAG: serine hydrolase domain-containing protein [Propionibacteriaceae bacterium]|jgi:CubicO group peptidase (beta-lactamase class C family)
MTDLRRILDRYVNDGSIPGAVALIARNDEIEVAALGSAAVDGIPMARESIFRLASITKPITATAVMILVEDGRITLDDPVDRWLPELANRRVVRTPASPIDDLVPAIRPITVFDLLTSRAGYGFPSDFTLPAVQPLFEVQKDGREPQSFLPQDAWMAALSDIPMLYQPGEAWLYDTCSTLQGVLISRVSGQDLPAFLAERIFEPLTMVDTGFFVPADQLERLTSYYRTGPAGSLELADAPDGQWGTPPPFPLGNGGLAGTVDDWLAFGRMLLAGGTTGNGHRLLSADAVQLMINNHTTPDQRKIGELFLEGQGWGFGGSVDIEIIDPWNMFGRYGWVGGTGTSAHIIPSTGTITILLAQVAAEGPTPPEWMRTFWEYAAGER